MLKRSYATRMSSFSLIYAIETDIRDIISSIVSADFSLPADIFQVAKERYYDNKKQAYDESIPLRELLDYVDFYDLSKILSVLNNVQNIFSNATVNQIIAGLQRLSKCRNRVCHSRPLEPDDFMDLLDFTYELVRIEPKDTWKNINESIRNLDNPAYVLSLDIPDFWKVRKKSIYNNLPLPEFDDTGFMGRKKDRDALNTLLLSNTKVISIVGEGGIGKTALAQRCLYDVLELCENKESETIFDIIVWVSLKTKKLTINGINQIHNAITSSSGLFNALSQALTGKDDIDTALTELSEYMSEFKVLLCIDNLETISSAEIRDFLANFPNKSKVLITTRIGLGEIEYRYKLDKMDDPTSINLMRSMSKLLNLNSLAKSDNGVLKNICSRLYNNPLLIKWYVLGLASGKPSTELLGNSALSFKEALKFCFENLYDQLGKAELMVISIIACLRRPVSAVELRFLMDETDDIEIEKALNQLHNSSMLESSSPSKEYTQRLFTLTDIAEEYLTAIRPVSKELYQQVKSKNQELQKSIEHDSAQKYHYIYDVNSIFWTTQDEKICSIYLKKALSAHKNNDSESAERFIQIAIKLMPDFSECYRINAFILKDASPFKSEREHEKSVECDPKSSIARYSYAQFLLLGNEYDKALEQIDAAMSIDPKEISLMTFKAWIFTLKGNYSEAILLYEKILPDQPTRLKKFRISSYDQTIECFRRQIEQLIYDRDFESVDKYLKRAFEIVSLAIESNDFDHRIIAKFYKLLFQAELSYRHKKSSILNDAFDLIKIRLDKLNATERNVLKEGLVKFITLAELENQAYAQNIINTMSEDSLKLGEGRITGKISRATDNGTGVSYGFIVGDDGNSYFFHRGNLNPDTLLDENRKLTISFLPSKSAKGLCAQEIHKL